MSGSAVLPSYTARPRIAIPRQTRLPAAARGSRPMRSGFRLGDSIIDPATSVVVGPRGAARLSSRSLDTLLVLAARAGETVSRDELLQSAWPEGGRHDEALSRCVSEVRHALGDSARPHAIIDTVPRCGYRLLIEPLSLSEADQSVLDTASVTIAHPKDSHWHFLLGGDRRQRVLRIAGAYAAVAWAVMQVADVTFERLGLSERGVTFVIVLAMLGFPIAVSLAWLYRPHHSRVRTRASPVALVSSALILVAGLSAAAYFLGERMHADAEGPVIAERSIAVLPFTNLSGDPANDYLADGLAEELSTQLARLPDLRVASRTSAFTFADGEADIATIAATLGVRHVLEGSLRRQDGRIRVTAQLIDASSGFHLWANTFDRSVEDIFAIEDSIASSVVEALKIVLSAEVREDLLARPTGSPGVYDLYLRGRGQLRSPSSRTSLDEAERLFRAALGADPAFAQAHAGLCEVGVSRYVLEKSADSVTAAEEACAQAARLDAGQNDVHMALGKLYLATGQSVLAEKKYHHAHEADPQDPHALLGLADALAGQGKAAEAQMRYEQAIELRPRYWVGYDRFGAFLFKRGRAADAVDQYRRVTELRPETASAWNNLGAAYFVMGEFGPAANAFRQSVSLDPTSEGYSNTGTMYYYSGRYRQAAEMFREATLLAPDDHVMWGNLGDAQRASGDYRAQALQSYDRAEGLVRHTVRTNPEDRFARVLLAYYLVRLGERDEARAEMRLAAPERSDNPYAKYYAALVYGELGEQLDASRQLRESVELGFPPRVLEVAPELDTLRTALRVENLMAELARH